MIELTGKTIVVIGATSGLGLTAARAIVAAGGNVVGVGKDENKVSSAQASIGKNALFLAGDATQPETAVRAIEAARTSFGNFSGLYHVAGGSGRRWGDGPLHELTDTGLSQTLQWNLSSVFFSSRAAVRSWMEHREAGSILNLGSVLAESPSPRFFATHAYTAAKSALVGLTRSWASYYAPHRIRFNLVQPGLVETPMSERAQNNPDIVAFMKSKQPLGEGGIGSPESLDALVVYFLSEASQWVTGQVISVDGGWSVSESPL